MHTSVLVTTLSWLAVFGICFSLVGCSVTVVVWVGVFVVVSVVVVLYII